MKPIDTKTPFVAIAESRIGGRRENQDTCAWQDTKHGFLLLVCDGMGGGPSGKIASQMAADAIVNSVLDSKPESDRRDVLARAIRDAGQALLSAQDSDPRLKGMGTTVTALLINRQSAVVAHVGDSRIYQLRGGCKVFRTFDHSHVFELVKTKALTEEDARLAADSNIITRALGPMENVEPDIEELPYEKGDRFMLCTDGIWGAMPEKELIKIAGGTKAVAGAVESLAIKVDEIGQSHGGTHDNLTVAILQTPFNSKLKQKMSTRIKYTLYALAAICCLSLLGNFVQYKMHARTSYTTEEAHADMPADAMVTRAELEKILADERARNDAELQKYRDEIRNQDEDYARKLAEFRQILSDVAPEDKKSDPKINVIAEDATNMQVVNEINAIISQLEQIKTMREKGDALDKSVANASKEMNKLTAKVKEMKIHDPEFEKCVDKKWITNSITKDVVNPKREGHIKAIIKALESLRSTIKQQSKKS